MNNFILIFSVVLFFGCNVDSGNSVKNKDVSIKSEIIISGLGFNCNVNSKIESDTLKLELFFYKPYLFDKESQKLLLSLYIYELKLNTILPNVKTVTYNYIDEDMEHDPLFFIHNESNIDRIKQEYSSNGQFVALARIAMNNISPQEILICNEIIKTVSLNRPDVFSFEGSFWLLLSEYAKDCDNENSNSTKLFKSFVKIVSIEGSGMDSKKLEMITNNCSSLNS